MSLDEEARILAESSSTVYSAVSNRDTLGRANMTVPTSEQPRARAGRLTLEEVIFDMRYSSVGNRNFDWSEDIETVRSTEEQHGGGSHVDAEFLTKLREQPLCIRDKLKLSRYLRDHIDTSGVSTMSRGGLHTSQVTRRYDDFNNGLWRNNIKRISAYHGTTVASYFQFLRFLVYLNAVLALLLFAFISLPQILSGEDGIPDQVVGYFGELSTSVMFYGAYSNTTWGHYERPLAYFLTWGTVQLLSFVVIILSMLVRYRRSKYGSSDEEFPYTWRLFTSWDHSVYSPGGAGDRITAIRTELKEIIRDERRARRTSLLSRLALYVVRVGVNLAVLAVLGGSGSLIYVVANMSQADSPLHIPDIFQDLVDRYELPVVVAGLKAVVPMVFDQLIKLERWHPRTALKLTIARTTLFYIASLIVFVASLYDVTTECIVTTSNTTLEQRNVSDFCCWENEVGEQVFKVLILDLGLTILVGLVFDILRAAIAKCCKSWKVGYREVSVASGVLDLTYGQALIWLGIYFSPFLAAIGVIKLVIIFYFQFLIARKCSSPPRKVFRASRSGNFYIFILLLHLFCTIFPQIYAIVELQPSDDCGPFRLENRVYDVIANRIGELPGWVQDTLDYLATLSVIIPVIILLLLVIIYYMARASSYKRVSEQLRNHLAFERRVEKRRVFAQGRVVHENSKISLASSAF